MSREAGIRSIPVRGMYLSIGEISVQLDETANRSSPNEQGGSCAQVGEPGTKTGRPEGLPRATAIVQRFAVATTPANEQAALAFVSRVAKPESPFWATKWTIGLISAAGKVRDSEVCVGIFMVVLGPLRTFCVRLLSAKSRRSDQVQFGSKKGGRSTNLTWSLRLNYNTNLKTSSDCRR